MMKYSRDIQAQFIAYLLHKRKDENGVPFPGRVQKGVKLFKHFQTLDQAVFEATFKVPGFTRIMEILGEYYAKHKDLPGQITYDQLKAKSKTYKAWYDKADPTEQVDIKVFENLIFQPPEDIPYIEAELLNFLSQSYAEQISREQRAELRDPDEDPYKIIIGKARQVQTYITSLQDEFEGNENEQQDVVTDEADLSNLRQLPGIPTVFRSVTLYYRGITIIVAPPKSFKTGISQNIAVDLMLQGKHVAWFDLENGLYRSVRRFYQNLLGVPKEWVYSNTYVHEDRIQGVEERSYDKEYSKGDRVYKIFSDPTGERVKVFSKEAGREIEVDEYVTKVRVFEASENGADHPDQWDELDPTPYVVEDVYEPLEDVLTRRLKEIKETTGGQVRVRYVANCTPSKIRSIVEDWRDDETEFFSHPEKDKVIIIDWMQHLGNEDKRLQHWEIVRQNYKQLKIIRSELNLYMLGIEAMKNYEKALDPHWSLKDLKVAGTDRIQYDAEAVAVLVGTDDEKQAGYRRMYVSEDRDGPSGDHTVEFIKIDYARQTAASVDPEVHRADLPDLWTEWENGPGKKSKNFAGVEKAQESGLEDGFAELSADELTG